MKYLKCIRNSSALDVVPGELYAITEERPGGYYKFLDRSGEQGFCKLEQSLVEFELVEDVTTVLKCYHAEEDDSCFTNGKLYEIKHDGVTHYVDDDEGDYHEISIADSSDNEWRPVSSSARLIEYDAAFSDEYEEEELKRLEKKLEQCQQTQETCCDVALAYQLSQIQKFLRESGADIELVVHKDFIAITDENCKEYRGNVEQILRYIKASGELSKVAGEMSGEH